MNRKRGVLLSLIRLPPWQREDEINQAVTRKRALIFKTTVVIASFFFAKNTAWCHSIQSPTYCYEINTYAPTHEYDDKTEGILPTSTFIAAQFLVHVLT